MSRRRPTKRAPAPDRTVMSIPTVLDGEPHIVRKGVLVRHVVKLFMQGLSLVHIARVLELWPGEVDAAIRYELRYRAAKQAERARIAAHALYLSARETKRRKP